MLKDCRYEWYHQLMYWIINHDGVYFRNGSADDWQAPRKVGMNLERISNTFLSFFSCDDDRVCCRWIWCSTPAPFTWRSASTRGNWPNVWTLPFGWKPAANPTAFCSPSPATRKMPVASIFHYPNTQLLSLAFKSIHPYSSIFIHIHRFLSSIIIDAVCWIAHSYCL